MDIDFNRLKVFYYIFSEKSIISASKKLHLTQPAVSQQLKKLEEEIKTKLFIRANKKLIPTAAGGILFKILEPFVQELNNGVESIRMPHKEPSGELRIGVPYEFGRKYMPGICNDFRKTYPKVRFTITLKGPAELLSLIKKGSIDFAIIDVHHPRRKLFSQDKGYRLDPLLDEELILACSKNYYENILKKNISYENLITKEFITDEYDALILKEWFKHHFKKIPKKLNIIMTSNSHQAVISSIKLDMGLGVTASHLVGDEIGEDIIIPVLTGKHHLLNRISIIQLQNKLPTLTENTFQDHLKEKICHLDVLQQFSKVSFNS